MGKKVELLLGESVKFGVNTNNFGSVGDNLSHTFYLILLASTFHYDDNGNLGDLIPNFL